MELSSGCKNEITTAYATVTEELIRRKNCSGWWEGRLSSSALATALAVIAMQICTDETDETLIRGAISWLAQDQNADGGWGDSPESPSNLPTTFIVLSAFLLGDKSEEYIHTRHTATVYVSNADCKDSLSTVRTISNLYGDDKTFAVPILVVGALSGRVEWRDIPSLPFEFSLTPKCLLRLANAGVVSYALPALIAVGQLLHVKSPSRNPAIRFIRNILRKRALNRLQHIQPKSGGFLEAQPLTSFVAMSLAASGQGAHPVARKCISFLRDTVRTDWSWPIDTDLSVWLTSQACLALPESETSKAREFLIAQQQQSVNLSTVSLPGGWAWTHRSGGVPDADDTSAALVCLSRSASNSSHTTLRQGALWLLKLQNADGGWPTFCRGRGHLPFDASAPELTAHAIRALLACRTHISRDNLDNALSHASQYLARTQRAEGSWVPLWFGNQYHQLRENAVLGTGRVILGVNALLDDNLDFITAKFPVERRNRAIDYLIQQQNSDGGWGGIQGVPSTIEETAIATEALANTGTDQVLDSLVKGVNWLSAKVFEGRLHSTPIGLYFANLWYSEELYPLVWTASALKAFLAMKQKAV